MKNTNQGGNKREKIRKLGKVAKEVGIVLLLGIGSVAAGTGKHLVDQSHKTNWDKIKDKYRKK